MTLKFIGEVPDRAGRADSFGAAAGAHKRAGRIAVRRARIFPQCATTAGLLGGIHSPESHARSGQERQGLSELGRLAGAVEAALEPIGIPREKREFSPHITLARFESTDGLDSAARCRQVS